MLCWQVLVNWLTMRCFVLLMYCWLTYQWFLHRDAGDITSADRLYSIKWLYPIHGVTEALDPSAKSAVLECQARSRIEERLEVSLTGVAPSASGQTRSIKSRAVTPKNSRPTVPEGVVVAEGQLYLDKELSLLIWFWLSRKSVRCRITDTIDLFS